MPEPAQQYVIGVGANQRSVAHGHPRRTIMAAADHVRAFGATIVRTSPIRLSRPVGPSRRSYVNAAWVIACDLPPDEFLVRLKQVERDLGRNERGQIWSARPIDLDIILWSGGPFHDQALTIPHRHWRTRTFVAEPCCRIAPDWRDPITGLTVRQTLARLRRRRPVADD